MKNMKTPHETREKFCFSSGEAGDPFTKLPRPTYVLPKLGSFVDTGHIAKNETVWGGSPGGGKESLGWSKRCATKESKSIYIFIVFYERDPGILRGLSSPFELVYHFLAACQPHLSMRFRNFQSADRLEVEPTMAEMLLMVPGRKPRCKLALKGEFCDSEDLRGSWAHWNRQHPIFARFFVPNTILLHSHFFWAWPSRMIYMTLGSQSLWGEIYPTFLPLGGVKASSCGRQGEKLRIPGHGRSWRHNHQKDLS